MANVFISHRGADLAIATKLATELRDKGPHTVWLDDWKIDLGVSIVQKINEGLAGPAALVLCLSASSSAWMDVEWMTTLARQLNGENVKLLPVRLTGGSLPPILADRKYADLSADWGHGVAALLKALS